MDYDKYQSVAKAAQKLWIIHACISALIILGIAIGIYILLYKHTWIFGIVALYTSIPFILAMTLSFTVPYGAFSWIAVVLFCLTGIVSYKKTRISRMADLFVISGGVLGKWTTVIKSSHIQTISSRQSFFQKRSGLIHLKYSYQSNIFGKEVGVQFLDRKEVTEMMKL